MIKSVLGSAPIEALETPPNFIVSTPFAYLKGYAGDIASLRVSIVQREQCAEYGKEIVTANDLCRRIVALGVINHCLSLTEAARIIQAGRVAPMFGDKQVLLWRSLGIDNHGNQFVPVIQNIDGQHPLIIWYWLKYSLGERQTTFIIQPAY